MTPQERFTFARQAAIEMLGNGPDPRDSSWNTYLTVGVIEYAALLDALDIPQRGATPTGATLFNAAQEMQEAQL